MMELNLTLNSKTAFIVGNGLSRKDFDVSELKDVASVYGCNAIYRDLQQYDLPDHLVAIDDKIKTEIENSSFPKDRVIFPPYDECFESAEYRDYPRNRSNAGMNAMEAAIRHGKTELWMLGFDFMLDMELGLSNIYDGTPCYGPETRTNEVFSKMRVDYFDWFAQKHSDVTFLFVYPKIELQVYRLRAKNVTGTYYEKLEDLIWHQKNGSLETEESSSKQS